MAKRSARKPAPAGSVPKPAPTRHAERALDAAQSEAARLGSEYAAPEHLLLALLRQPDSAAVRALESLGVDPDGLCEAVESRLPSGGSGHRFPRAHTPRLDYALRLAEAEADRMRNRFVGADHLLLGLVAEGRGLPARLLARHGVTLSAARQAVGAPSESEAPTSPASSRSPGMHTLLRVLEEEAASHTPTNKPWLVAIPTALFVTLALFGAAVVVDTGDWRGLGITFFMLLLAYATWSSLVGTRAQKQAARQLAQYRDKRLLSHFLTFLTWPDAGVRAAAERALIQLLPAFGPADAALVKPADQRGLARLLAPAEARRRPDLALAALTALAHVGTPDALPAVARLARTTPRSEAGHRVQSAAAACLQSLELRRAARAERVSLLRPSAPSAAPHDPAQLLRIPCE